MNEELIYIYTIGAYVLGVIGIILIAAFCLYFIGKKTNKGGYYASNTLIVGGILFFSSMMVWAYLESGPYNATHSGWEGVIPGVVSLAGVLLIIIGMIIRVIVGFRNNK